MLKLNTSTLRVLLGLILLTLMTAPTLMAETPHLAATQLSGTVVTWQPQAEYEQLTLRISGPTGTFTRVFNEDEVPFFDLATLEGTVDGSYSFELTASPRLGPEVRQMLQAARERGEDVGLERRLRSDGILPVEPLIQSGYLTVTGGQFVNLGVQEPSGGGALQPRTAGGNGVSSTGGESVRNLSAADQLINDDLIVTGSICVGFDCVNGENFGFDTIRLKENNLRIKFQDTSNSASFPTNDWQITANDSANGGAEKFSIDDIDGGRTPFTIEARAPSNSLYVDDGGRLGLGTSTPVVDVHVVSGNTPTLRLEQNGSSGFTPQTWDVAGNETNFFIRDVSNGSTLPIRIRPGAPTSSIDISGDGNVGIGTTSPSEAVHLQGTDNPRVLIEDTTDNTNDKPGLVLRSPAAAGGGDWRFETDNGGNFQIDFGPSPGAEILLSDSTGTNSTVTINGNLMVNGTCTGCDAVFQPDYELESIETHATLMWHRSHLPAVGPTPEGKGPINVFEKTTGILQELEKAHIYIEQLHKRLAKLEELVSTQNSN